MNYIVKFDKLYDPVFVYSTKSGKEINKFSVIKNSSKFCLHPQEDVLAIMGYNELCFYNLATGKLFKQLIGEKNVINSIAADPYNEYLAIAGSNGVLNIYSIKTGKLILNQDFSSSLMDVKWIDNARVIIKLFGNQIKIFDTILRRIVWSLDTIKNDVTSFSSSFGSNLIYLGFDNGNILVWDYKNNIQQSVIPAHKKGLCFIECVDELGFIISVSYDGYVKFWSSGNHNNINQILINPKGIKASKISSNRKYLVLLDYDNFIKIFDITKMQIIKSYNTSNLTSFCVSYDGNVLITSDYKKLKFWDVLSEELLGRLNEYTWGFNKMNTTNDGNYLFFSDASEKIVKLYYLEEMFNLVDYSDSLFTIVKPQLNVQNVDFGTCLVNNAKDTLLMTFIENKTHFKIKVDSIKINEGDTSSFQIVSSSLLFIIDPYSFHTVELRFLPKKSGKYKAFLNVYSSSETFKGKLTGEGVNLYFDFVSKMIDFGKVNLGSFKDTFNVLTFWYNGYQNFIIDTIKIGYPNISDFYILNPSGKITLQPGEVKYMDLRFRPSDFGRTSGTLEFYYNGPNSPAVVQLFGEGVKYAPKIQTSSINFPTLVCERSVTKNLFVSNSGGSPLEITKVEIVGPDAGDYNLRSILPLKVLPDSTTLIEFEFFPSSPGTKTAEIVIYSNSDPDSVLKIPISGRKELIDYSLSINEIDLGYLCPNEGKDTIVTLTNSGTLPINLQILSTDNIATAKTFNLDVNQSINVPINFKGFTSEGVIDEQVTFFDSLCSVMKTVRVVGKVFEPKLVVNDTVVNSIIGDTVTFEIPIKNSGERTVRVLEANGISGSFNLKTVLPITIGPGESKGLEIQYHPTNSVEEEINLQILAEPCKVVNQAKLKGIPFEAIVYISTIDTEGYPGDIVEIPIVLDSSENLNLSGVKAIDLGLEFNPTLLYPKGFNYDVIDAQNGLIVLKGLSIEEKVGKVLAKIPFVVGLGNQEKTDIVLRNLMSSESSIILRLKNGSFRLLGLCYEGGTRLVNSFNRTGIISLKPNPVDDILEVEFELHEKGTISLSLFNSFGELVCELLENSNMNLGTHKLKFDLKSIPNGLYFILFKTPTIYEIKAVNIFR